MSAPLRSLVSLSLFLASSGVALAQDDDGSLMDSLEDADGTPGDAPALEEDEPEEGEEEEDEYEYPEDRAEAEAAAAAEDEPAREPPPPPEPAGGESPKWKFGKPGLAPAIGAIVYPGGAVAAVGARATLGFRQDTQEKFYWGGHTRAVGQILLGTEQLYSGYAVRVGAFAGPRYRPFRVDVGPDFFYNAYNFADPAPFSGVGLPVTAYFDVKGFGLYGGVEPAWYISGDWPSVDWDAQDLFGFGDEFTYVVGGDISTSSLALGLGYSHRITGFGVFRGITIGLGF